METQPPESLSVALTYVFNSFGEQITVENMRNLVNQINSSPSIPELPILETGQYGTYPYKDHSIIQFDDGNYHYVDHPADRTIIDSTDGVSKSMGVYGTPVKWYSYGYDKTKVQPVNPEPYMTATVNGIDYKSYGAPKKMYVRKPEGSQLIDFSVKVSTPREFLGIPNSAKKYGDDVRIMGTATYSIRGYPDEVFYVTLDDWGLFTSTGHIDRLQGYPEHDLTELQPPKEILRPKELVATTDIGKPVTSLVKQSVSLSDIKPASDVRTKLLANFIRYVDKVQYVSEDGTTVMFYDLTGKGEPIALRIDSSATIIGELPHPKTGEIWLREGTTEKTGRWYAAPENLLMPETEADALASPSLTERLQRVTDPNTGKQTTGGRFTATERYIWVPFAWLTAHYNRLSNKLKRK